MHTGLWCTLTQEFLTGVGWPHHLAFLRTSGLPEFQCALCSALCRHSGACTCLPRVPQAHSVVHTSYRWLAPHLLAQAGRDTGRSQIGVFLGERVVRVEHG